MTTMTDQIQQVIAYLVTQAQQSASLGLATPPVIILDGPPATTDPMILSPGGLTRRLWVGAEGDPGLGAAQDAATSAQQFAFLDHARTRDEDIEVMCAAEAGSGDGVMAEARAGAFAVMGAVEVMLRGDTASGGPGDASMGGLAMWSQVTGGDLVQRQMPDGAWALVRFRVSAHVRLTS